MSEEFKDARKRLEESLREMEILKRKALRLEDENKHLVRIMINDKIKINKCLFKCQGKAICATRREEDR